MSVRDIIHSIITGSISSAKSDNIFPDEIDAVDVKIEYPREQKFGDYATPFAMESARVLRRSPLDIGESLAPYIEKDDRIDHVDVVKPGFINIFLSSSFLFENLKEIITQREKYGQRKKDKSRKVNIEFVSANPTGPLNIVSARAAAVGDTIANLLEFSGDLVDREFYVNDFGNQVDLLGKSVLSRMKELNGDEANFPEDGYHGEYVYDIARYIQDTYAKELARLSGDEVIEFLAKKAVEYNVKGQKEDLEKFNVTFKTWFSERSMHESKSVNETLESLKRLDVLYSSEDKLFFRSTDYQDDKDRVVVRDDGRPTYLMADISYHNDKIKRGYDLLIDIWGPDHHGYIARLSGAVKALGFGEDFFKILIVQQVNLLDGGETVKMSKRLGKFSTMKELIDEIGMDVARYFFVMRSMDSHLDFDLALAKKESSENPVYYLQYAHARICSIFRKAEEMKFTHDLDAAHPQYLDNSEAKVLLKLMAKYPEEVYDAADKFEPHRIPTFLMRLAQAFHRFYTEHRVLSDESERTNSYLALSDAVRVVIKSGLTLLGVSAPESM